MNPMRRILAPRAACVAAALLAPSWSQPAAAGDLDVRVVQRGTGEPVDGAAVCVGTRADPGQMGAYRAPSDGLVRFDDLPRARLVVTVSREGYRGERRELEPFDGTRVVMVRLARGGLGPRCRDPVPYPGGPTAGALRVQAFRAVPATGQSGVVELHYTLDGEATHYRVGTERDLAGAQWHALEDTPRARVGEPVAGRTVYFQVRRYRERVGASLQVRSSVVHDTVRDEGAE